MTADDIKNFIQKEIHGLVGHRTSGNAKDFKNPLVVVYYNVDYVRDVKGSNYVRNRVIKVAKKLKDEGLKLNFAISNSQEFKGELNEFGVENVEPNEKYILGRGAKDEKFKFTGEYSVENLEKFARDLLAGNLEQFLKSEPIPTQDGPVKVVVAKNFDEIVNDETKDVLIEFYAPWCGHCKNLVPVYDALATKLKSESDIVIAKMDATANDVPSHYDVKGFPTLYFAPKGKKRSPLKYEGGREEKDFIQYIAKHSTDPLKGYERNGQKKNVEL
jgi:protein disulfide-isomerase A3